MNAPRPIDHAAQLAAFERLRAILRQRALEILLAEQARATKDTA